VSVIVPLKLRPGSSRDRYQHSRGICCFHIQSRRRNARKCTVLQVKQYLSLSLWGAQMAHLVQFTAMKPDVYSKFYSLSGKLHIKLLLHFSRLSVNICRNPWQYVQAFYKWRYPTEWNTAVKSIQVKGTWRHGTRSAMIYTLQHVGLLLCNEIKKYMMAWGM
jgi:hypothetical protein